MKDKCNDAGPVDKRVLHRDLHYHIVPSDVIDDEWECVHQCQ